MAQKNIIKRIISSPMVQTFLIYISGGWIALEMTDYIIDKYGLSEKFSDVLPIILLIGLPVAIFMAWYLSREKEEVKEKAVESASDRKQSGFLKTMRKKPWFSISGMVLLIILMVSGIRYIHRQNKIKWATEVAISEIGYYAFNKQGPEAYQLLKEAQRYIPDNPEVISLAKWVSKIITIITDPPGAEIYIREYSKQDDEWELIGSSPIDSISMPGRTFYECKIEKEGYEPLSAVLSTNQDTLYRKLFKSGTIPSGMVPVIGYRDESAGYHLTEKSVFFIDKYEVTNIKYKEFVDIGGYRNPKYWKYEFIKDGEILSWDEAIKEFTDKTERPGPATWEASDYPEGQGEYPVGGISWYEASAYADYADKELPTVMHWYSASGVYIGHFGMAFGQYLIPLSNMKDNGPAPVGYYGGVGCYGNYDMAGNVREWCWNEIQDGRVVIGGGWNDVSYMYTTTSQALPFDRSPKNGFRCVKYLQKENIPESAFQAIDFTGGRDFFTEKPVTDEVFQVFRKQFLYDKTDLQPVIEARDESSKDWIKEKISFQAAYENDRMIAYLFLPKRGDPPYQTLIFFPGSNAVYEDSISHLNIHFACDFLLNNNIAVMWPIYKGTFERNDGLTLEMHSPNESHTYTEYLVKWVKDCSRSIDYLETRPDIDVDKIGFYGFSWGGALGSIIPAIEERLKLSVINAGGLHPDGKAYPEADMINYVTRVKIPVLMLNGNYDFNVDYETAAKPMFELLGTPEKDKVLKVYKSDHIVPKAAVIEETLNWLEKYFGPAMN
jgi:dienelactone hydrolase